MKNSIYPILDIEFCNSNNIKVPELLSLWLNHPSLIDFIQLRAKNETDTEIKYYYEEIKRAFPNLKIIINDRWNLALELQSFGVHLGKEDFLKLNKIEKDRLKNIPIYKGTSSHCIEDVKNLDPSFWSYSGFGPIFPTNTKVTNNAILGVDKLKEAVKISKVPIVAIGGINFENFTSVLETGVYKIASISLMSDKNMFERLISNSR